MIRVAFACNNPDNGLFEGYFEHVNVDDAEIQLEGPRMRIRFLEPGRISIGRRQFTYKRHAEWVGNWCWDEISTTPEAAADILNFLIARGFSIIAGPSDIFETQHFTPKALLEACA